MKRASLVLLFCLTMLLPLSAANGDADEPLYGFTAASSRVERDWENKFKAIPDPKIMRDTMQRLSARPHHVGSPYDKQNAEWILSQFKSWGLSAEIETFDVLFPTPKERLVELIAPTRYTAKLQEPPVAVDPTSGQQSEQLPVYNAYSTDGDVTGPLVYVNYGLLQDYEELDLLGVSVKGAIVIARYGNSWRGIKPKVAAEHGAIGCIIYSDPADDGYGQGDVFPDGPMRNENGAQRGSVLDAPIYPGDPLTPGVGAKGNVKRLAIKDAPTITKIPVLPISYGDAQPLLAAIKGPMGPAGFRGGLPIPYHVGPGPATVHLKLAFNWDIKPVYDVIARIPGTESPDQWVVRGNHHDGWVNGAQDPISGQIALLEEARALSELLKQGWKPKRTIIYCAWDGEEPMLLGSTEWAEYHADELQRHAAIYINTDVNGRGFLEVEGSHSLEKFVNSVSRDITDPEKNISVWKRQQAGLLVHGRGEGRKEARSRPDLRIGALGSGSDYTTFLDHLGVASLNVLYGGEDEGGIYHSIYDDFYWFTHFSDTEFVYGRALAQTIGVMVMRFAGADVLPYDFNDFADTIHKYSAELKKLLKEQQEAIHDRNQALDDGAFNAASDPRHPTFAPKREALPPFLNFAPLDNAEAVLAHSAERYSKALKTFLAKGASASPQSLQKLNTQLQQAEQRLTNAGGLPRRPWYKHLIYAPGFYTGYGAKTIPGVREGIEEKRYQEAEAEIVRAAKALEDYAGVIDAVAGELEK
ncbi:MAG TPA: transferrin receptor-like dimerization domain-containing protein [Candidatus Saccharimonadales bacterium]|nr:transferrin receptor-like dimerization domain-containing protein [Candidatus Saccharimonadales bacterium]